MSATGSVSHATAWATEHRETILLVARVEERRVKLAALVEGAGWRAVTAGSTTEALWQLSPALPHLVVVDVSEPSEVDSALDLIGRIRAQDEAAGSSTPVLVVLPRRDRDVTLAAFARHADDVIAGRLHGDELVARIRVRLERRPVPRSELHTDPVTGALTPAALRRVVEREVERVSRGGRPGVLALLTLHELPELEARDGSRARDEILAQVVAFIHEDSREIDFVGHTRDVIAVLMPATRRKGGQIRLERLTRLLYSRTFLAGGTTVRLTPIVGYAASESGLSTEELEERAWLAMMHQAEQLDLHPTPWLPAMSSAPDSGTRIARAVRRATIPAQIVVQQLACLVVPLAAYVVLDHAGIDVTSIVYLLLVVALGLTAGAIWAEGFAALRRTEPPDEPDVLPSATAVIAAYLPNEAATVIETVEAFLHQDYPDFQVILAYNTPQPLPVEEELHSIQRRDPRFEAFRVEGSVSKAQNVNAALARVRGEITGLFDADHHPDPGAFRRAARWLANGADVVQGHCVVRNGAANRITRLVATEFEAIYAVSHPGRARLHGFGIFGGSNGYWRTEVLKRKRMRGSMLTEDIDSSMRVTEAGGRIISDPGLVSTELAPDTARALWNQRMRWAQGWSQVSLRHIRPMVRRQGAPLRSRIGAIYLLAWREVYPWISLQMFPLLAFWWLRGDPPIDFFVPIFVVTTLFTLSAGPAQTLFAWKLAHPSIRRHGRWFLWFLVASLVFYTEVKNIIARTAHLKELMGEKTWVVTPRAARPVTADQPGSEDRRASASVGASLRERNPAAGAKPAPAGADAPRLTTVESAKRSQTA